MGSRRLEMRREGAQALCVLRQLLVLYKTVTPPLLDFRYWCNRDASAVSRHQHVMKRAQRFESYLKSGSKRAFANRIYGSSFIC